MNNLKKYIVNALAVIAFAGLLSSCEDFFSPNPDDILLEKNYPSTVTELYSGFMGIASKVQVVADHAGFIEGLRGDFLEPTPNSTPDIIDLYWYRESDNNELADPKGYYAVILNANDYIKHAIAFYEANPTSINDEMLGGLIGGALRYKTWAYLMLAKIYGEAIWIDEPLERFTNIGRFPKLGFDELIDKCLATMNNGITVKGKVINGMGTVRWSSVLFPGQGESAANLEWNRICPDPELLLAELYLFKGEYQLVVDNAIAIIRKGGTEASYQLNRSEWAGEWIGLFRQFYRKESIFMLTYDYNLKQTNRLIDYYNNLAPNKYLMRPTQVSMDLFQAQIRQDGNQGDVNRGNGKTYKMSNGQWIVNKFSSGHETVDKIYRNDVLITLYRSSDVFLWLTEALGQLGRFQEAMVFLDGGIETYYNTATGSFLPPFTGYPASLYRTSSTSEGASQGVRGRVVLNKVGDNIVKNPSPNIDEDKRALDMLLIDETCMESAGEARAYYAMMRIAKRWNDPSILADKVSAKYPEGQRDQIRVHLMNPANWFVKFNLEK